jgi:hypothetical protein
MRKSTRNFVEALPVQASAVSKFLVVENLQILSNRIFRSLENGARGL